jgi:hypothetical protein
MVADLTFLTPELLQAFFAVVAIDLVLAGDNAVVIGLAAAGLEKTAARQGDPDRDRLSPRSCASPSPSSRRNCCCSSGLLFAGGVLAALGRVGRCGGS